MTVTQLGYTAACIVKRLNYSTGKLKSRSFFYSNSLTGALLCELRGEGVGKEFLVADPAEICLGLTEKNFLYFANSYQHIQ